MINLWSDEEKELFDKEGPYSDKFLANQGITRESVKVEVGVLCRA